MLSGCTKVDHQIYHDPQAKLNRSEFGQVLTPTPPKQEQKALKRPKTAPKVAKTIVPKIFQQKVSLNVNDKVPIKQTLMAMAKQINVNLLVDRTVRGYADINVKDRPFIDVINDLCEDYNLVYKINGNCLKVMADRPYLHTYHLQSLAITIENSTSTKISTDIFNSNMNEQNNNKQGSGSSTAITTKSTHDFWQELEKNIKLLSEKLSTNKKINHIINKQAGLITIIATNRQHKIFKDYFGQLTDSLCSQVLIEAKIIEVVLNDDYKMGINWNMLWDKFNFGNVSTVTTEGFKKKIFNKGFRLSYDTQEPEQKDLGLDGVANLFDSFGTVRAISNPRITVTNNQTAILKVVTNKVFFEVTRYHGTIVKTFDKDRKQSLREHLSEPQDIPKVRTLPVGFIMAVHPVIDKHKGEVTLYMHPSISKCDGEGVSNPLLPESAPKVPQVRVREVSSIAHLKDGQIIILGGLMDMTSSNTSYGLPSARPFNVIGKKKESNHEVKELVILLKCTILDNNDHVIDPQDRRIYNNMISDGRRWQM